MRVFRGSWLGLSAMLCSLSLFQGVPSAMADAPQLPRPVASVEGITEYRLENGLQILLVPDPSRPTVTVNLTVFCGSRHEGYGEAGMAHLLEHMVFKGTPDHPEVPKVLQAHGAQFNGTTWVDRTNYFETLPASAENLEFAIRLEADRMMNSFIKGEDLASEMTVVRNEFERGENSPSRVLGQRMMSAAYEWHNYGKSTIGNRSDIERVPVEKLRAFYKRFYQPDNAALVIAGKFDEKPALEYVQKYFGSIPRPDRELDLTYTEEPAQDGERIVMLRRVGEVAMVGVVYHIPAGAHPDFAAVEILQNILTASPSGRLYKALVESKKAASLSGVTFAWHDPGVIRIMAEVSRGNQPEVVLDTLVDTVDLVIREGVTDQEVDRARTQLLKRRELAAADTRGIAIDLSEWAAQGDWRLYFLHRDRLEAVTTAEVNDVAKRFLVGNNRTVGMYIPTEVPDRTEIPSTPDIRSLVADYKGREDISAGEAFDVSPANIDARTIYETLPNRLQVALLPKRTRGESVQLRLTLRYGNLDNLKKLEMASSFLPDLMIRGTKKLNREQLQDELDQNGARLSAGGVTGLASFSLQTKRSKLPAVIELLRQVLREPSLPEDELEVLRNRQLASLKQDLAEPRALASRQLGRVFSPYPQDDVRYLPTIEEEIARVQEMRLDELRKLHEHYLDPSAGQLVVVGDFDPDELRELLVPVFADWKASQPYERIVREMPAEWKPGTQQIETPDKANAVYTAGMVVGISDVDEAYPALLIGNYILGAGALSSRLGDRIRQKEGLSYGVASGFNADSLDPRATFTIMAICNPENMGKVDVAAREELERLLRDGMTEDELNRARMGFLQRQEVSRTDDGNLARILGAALYANRTMTYYADLEQKIQTLSPNVVRDTLRKYFDPKELIIIQAGDFAAAKRKQAEVQTGEKPEAK